MSDGIWTQFIADTKRPEDTPIDAYPQSLDQLRLLWLPPDSVVAFLERTATEKGISQEAKMWLNRVKRAKESIKLTQEDTKHT